MWGPSFRGLICKSHGTVWSLLVENGRALLIWGRDNHIMNLPIRKTEVTEQVCPELLVPGNYLSYLILHCNNWWHSSLKLHLCSADLKRKHSKFIQAQPLFCSSKKKKKICTWHSLGLQVTERKVTSTEKLLLQEAHWGKMVTFFSSSFLKERCQIFLLCVVPWELNPCK